MKIGVDLDGVLSQTIPAIIAFHNEKYGTHFVLETFHSNEYWKVWGGTKAEAIEKVSAFYKTDYYKNIQPIPGAKESLEVLKKNNELVIITGRGDEIQKDTWTWINTFYPNIFSEIYFTNHFTEHDFAKSKKEVCDEVGADVMIEDVIQYAAECVAPHRKVFLLDNPWNQTDALPDGITRVYAWKEVEEDLEK